MDWLGAHLRLIFPATHDPIAQQLARQLDERRDHLADLTASRVSLEQRANSMNAALSDLSERVHG